MLQDLISSSPCHKSDTCLNKLSDHSRVAILSTETNQSHLWSESEVPQVGCDRQQGRGQFTTIVAIASSCIGADPLASMHLKDCRPCPDHLPALATSVARHADGIKSALSRRQEWITRQCSLSCCLTCCIDIKDNVATVLSIEDASN